MPGAMAPVAWNLRGLPLVLPATEACINCAEIALTLARPCNDVGGVTSNFTSYFRLYAFYFLQRHCMAPFLYFA